jgi:hypothetical protein
MVSQGVIYPVGALGRLPQNWNVANILKAPAIIYYRVLLLLVAFLSATGFWPFITSEAPLAKAFLVPFLLLFLLGRHRWNRLQR